MAPSSNNNLDNSPPLDLLTEQAIIRRRLQKESIKSIANDLKLDRAIVKQIIDQKLNITHKYVPLDVNGRIKIVSLHEQGQPEKQLATEFGITIRRVKAITSKKEDILQFMNNCDTTIPKAKVHFLNLFRQSQFNGSSRESAHRA